MKAQGDQWNFDTKIPDLSLTYKTIEIYHQGAFPDILVVNTNIKISLNVNILQVYLTALSLSLSSR